MELIRISHPTIAGYSPFAIRLNDFNNTIIFAYDSLGTQINLITNTTNFNFNEWHTVSVSYGSQGLKIALDGITVATRPSMILPLIGKEAFINLPEVPFGGLQFTGKISAFRISYRQSDWQLAKRYKTPTIMITQNNGVFNQVCAGDTSKFSASCSNCGTNYTLQWKVNGNNVGTNSNLYNTTTINNNDIVTCQVYNPSLCPDTGAISNPIQAVVNNPPTINITSNSPVCLSDTITLFSNSYSNNPYRIWRTNSMVTYTITPTVLANNGINYSTTNFNGNLDNGVWKNVNVPFSFKYFNNTYNKIHINTNGYVSFGIDTGYNSSVTFIPNPVNQNNYIGGPWADLDLSTSGKIEYGIFGTAPNRIFMIRYYAPTIGFTTDIDTSAIYINETSNTIRVAWKKYNNSISWPMTIGLEDSTGTRGVAPFDVNNNYISENPTDRMYYFYPNPLTYSWSGPSSFTSTAQNPVILNSTAANAGTYTVNVTDASGCTNSASINVSVGTFPISISAVPNDTICAGTSVSLTASGATSYSWSGGITNGNSFTPTTSGTYTVTATNASGCASTSTILVTVKPTPTLTITSSPNDSICAGSVVTLTATGGGTYSWTGGVSNGVPFTPSTSSVYTVTVTGTNGCTKTQLQPITVNSIPTVTLLVSPNDTICSGTTTIFTASGGGTYSWTGGISNGVAFIPNTSNVYTVTVTGTNGCTKTQTQSLTVNPSPTITIAVTPNDTVCVGASISLNATGSGTYVWSNGVQNNISFLPMASATYTVTASGSNGCSQTQTQQVVINALPIVNISVIPNDTICQGDLVTLTASGGVTYTWSGGVINGNSFSLASNSTFSVVVADAYACSSTSNQSIVVKPNLIPSLSISSSPLQGVTNDP
ncbi:MAG TPA: hypothetical protein PLU10_10050, partial [Chitinophagaceae bacterium]|nr:hypothetical protein [Chitinophagaceae bacterium]